MLSLITGDLHFSDNARDDYRHTFMKRFRSIVRKYKVDQVIILGDLTEEKDRHGAWLVNQITDHIYRLSKLCSVIIIRGNHDAIDPSSPFFAFLGRFDNVEWINNPKEKTLMSGERALFLPHTSDYEKDWSSFDMSSYDWIFAHNTFAQAYAGHGQKLEGTPLSIFPTDARVISGDIHIPQKLGPVTYVGAPYLVDFGDDYKPRLILLDNGRIRSLAAKGAQKRLVEINSIEELHDQSKLSPGDILKIRVNIKPSEYAKWPEMLATIRNWENDSDYRVHTVQPILQQSRRKRLKTTQTKSKSDKDILIGYTNQQGIDERTTKIGVALMAKS